MTVVIFTLATAELVDNFRLYGDSVSFSSELNRAIAMGKVQPGVQPHHTQQLNNTFFSRISCRRLREIRGGKASTS